MNLSTLFKRCLEIPYTHIENSADYALERRGDTLYIYLECSNGEIDWLNNLDFPAKAYSHPDGDGWMCHRGFMRVFKSLETHIADSVRDKSIKGVVTVGYSHGAALATLCHEYVWYNRPDLRDKIEGYGFGAPRVLWGYLSHSLARRWERFLTIRNIDDIVTHLPPKILGYTHIGTMLEIGKKGKYSQIDAHRPENMMQELLEYEKNLQKM